MNPNVTWIELTGLGWMLVLAGAMFVPLRVRRVLQTLLQRGVQVASLAAMAACGAYMICPDAAPHCFTSALAPLSDALACWLGEPYRPLIWLAVATVVTLIAFPLSIAIGFARRLDLLGGVLRRIAAGAVRPAGAPVADATAVAGSGAAGRDEFDEAVSSMTAAATERPRQARRRKLSDFLDQPS